MKKEATAKEGAAKEVDVVLTPAMRRLRHELETHPVFAEIVHTEALQSFMEVH